MADGEVRLTDVYGISRDVPLNYVTRPEVDDELLDALTRGKHIVIHGSSKQGKTCLRKWNLEEHEYIVVTCSNKWDLGQLHSAILKQAGYTVEQSTTRTVGGGHKITAKLGAKVGWPAVGKIPGVEAAAEVGGEKARDDRVQVTTEPLELDPADVNDIITALKKIEFDQFVVLEDFHYLPEETQKDFAVALKAFHEGSEYAFIVVGVWLDENRLIQWNGDLSGRVIAVNADEWSEAELLQVIAKGEELLNIAFDSKFKQDLVAGCYDSVYVVQEACYRACDAAKVYFKKPEKRRVGEGVSATEMIKAVVDTQSARYNTFISNFAGGFKKTQLEMYKWLLVPVLTAPPELLERGLKYNVVYKAITAHHPEGAALNAGNLTQALQSAAALQVALNIKPIILDYHQSARLLNVVDRGFLIWLKQQNLEDLLIAAGLPPSVAEKPPLFK